MLRCDTEHLDRDTSHVTVQAVRRDAKALLRQLIADRAAVEQRLAETGRLDALKTVTGRSALDNAVSTTERILRSIDHVDRPRPLSGQSTVAQPLRGLTPEAMPVGAAP